MRGSVSMSVVCPHDCFGVTECPRAYLRSAAQEASGDSCVLTKATNSPHRAALGVSSSGIYSGLPEGSPSAQGSERQSPERNPRLPNPSAPPGHPDTQGGSLGGCLH